MPPFILQSESEDQTHQIGAALAKILRSGDVIALHGQLGAGKTALVRGVAAGLGLDPSTVSSPTFVIAHEYTPRIPAQLSLWHLDAYRLGQEGGAGTDELDTIGWDHILASHAAIMIEWAERIDEALPTTDSGRRGDILITHTGPHSRQLEITLPGTWSTREGFSAVTALLPALPQGWTLCPITRRPVPPDSPTFPFADERARMADLGRWLTGGYTVSRELTPEDLDDPDVNR